MLNYNHIDVSYIWKYGIYDSEDVSALVAVLYASRVLDLRIHKVSVRLTRQSHFRYLCKAVLKWSECQIAG